MCKPASFIITKGPRVWWLEKSDSHEEIIRVRKLHADGIDAPNIVKVEIVPLNGNLSLLLKKWIYRVDQDMLPNWYEAKEAEALTRAELKKWATIKLKGWKVKEAFNSVNPLLLPTKKVSQDEFLKLLKEWDNVRANVWTSVRDVVRVNAWISVGEGVWNSVGHSVWEDGVGRSVWDSMRDSMCDSMCDSIEDSVCDSLWAYCGGLFPNIKDWKFAEKLGDNPWKPLLKLWYAGYVPSFDGTVWRLHCGKNAKVVLEWKPKT